MHHVFYRGQSFLTCVFFTSAQRQAKALLLTEAPIALLTRPVNDSLTPFSPTCGRRVLISLHPHAVIATFIF
jgi:hypothetical protein